MRVLKLIVLIVVALAAVSFASINADGSVVINYYVDSVEVPVIILVLSVFLLGVVLGVLLMLGPYLTASHHFRKEKREHMRDVKQLKGSTRAEKISYEG